jgi:hypothetical protein
MAIHVCPPAHQSLALPATSALWTRVRARSEEWAQRTRKPDAVRRLTHAFPRERALVVTCDQTDATLIATNAALHRIDGTHAWSRWGWEQIARPDWAQSTSTLTLVGMEPVMSGPVELTIPTPWPVLDLARERIAWTTLLAVRLALPSGETLGVVVRRHPSTDQLDWFLYPDARSNLDDPPLGAGIDAALAAFRADVGL